MVDLLDFGRTIQLSLGLVSPHNDIDRLSTSPREKSARRAEPAISTFSQQGIILFSEPPCDPMGPPAAENPTTLFTNKFSAYAKRVQIAMVEKGIPFHAVEVDLKNKPKELLGANPLYGKVPTMVHDGNALSESLVILEYLDEAFPETIPLLPEDPLARSKCRFWADFICKGGRKMLLGVLAAPGSPERAAAVEEHVKFVRTLESAMLEFSKDGPFFCGDKFGYLDVVMSPSVIYSPFYESMGLEIPEQDFPRRRACLKAISEHKSVKETLPTLEELEGHMANYWGLISSK